MEKIPNPFREAWLEFNKDKFKHEISTILDEIIESNGEKEETIEELDEAIGYVLLLLKYKDDESMNVVRSSLLPADVLVDLGLYEDDILSDEDDEAYIPTMLIYKYINPDRVRELQEAGILELEDKDPDKPDGKKKNKNGKNLWLI